VSNHNRNARKVLCQLSHNGMNGSDSQCVGEAGVCRVLTSLGARCEVVAPTLLPMKPGDRVPQICYGRL
jgi:hypothetical protein